MEISPSVSAVTGGTSVTLKKSRLDRDWSAAVAATAGLSVSIPEEKQRAKVKGQASRLMLMVKTDL